MDPLAPVLAFLDAHYWTLWAFILGASFGATWGLRGLSDAHTDHQNTLREMARLLGHFEAAVEVLDEHDLTGEAAERGQRYAESNVIDLTHTTATEPPLLDRVRDRLPF